MVAVTDIEKSASGDAGGEIRKGMAAILGVLAPEGTGLFLVRKNRGIKSARHAYSRLAVMQKAICKFHEKHNENAGRHSVSLKQALRMAEAKPMVI